jgi:hypothetical protein
LKLLLRVVHGKLELVRLRFPNWSLGTSQKNPKNQIFSDIQPKTLYEKIDCGEVSPNGLPRGEPFEPMNR